MKINQLLFLLALLSIQKIGHSQPGQAWLFTQKTTGQTDTLWSGTPLKISRELDDGRTFFSTGLLRTWATDSASLEIHANQPMKRLPVAQVDYLEWKTPSKNAEKYRKTARWLTLGGSALILGGLILAFRDNDFLDLQIDLFPGSQPPPAPSPTNPRGGIIALAGSATLLVGVGFRKSLSRTHTLYNPARDWQVQLLGR